ncbi:MAG: NnrS family protein [Hyphomicrobiales bacterium]
MIAIAAHRIFFPAALAQAMVDIGVWVFAPPPFVLPLWHAHELVFGYGLAVAAGFLFTKTTPRAILLAAALWTTARLVWLTPNSSPMLRAALTVLATGVIVTIAAGSFWRGIKRGQNVVFPTPLLVLGLCELASQLPALGVGAEVERPAVLTALFAMVGLILVMGGRIVGAALSGLVQRLGGARMAPRLGLEIAILAALAGVALSFALDAPPLMLAAFAFAGSGVVLFRVASWHAALRLAGLDLLTLLLAQLFIAAGLAGIGAKGLDPAWPGSAPLHLVTIGGIGMTTLAMMLKTAAQRERRKMPIRIIGATAFLLAVAAVLRAGFHAFPDIAYPLAASAWIFAMALSSIWLVWRR